MSSLEPLYSLFGMKDDGKWHLVLSPTAKWIVMERMQYMLENEFCHLYVGNSDPNPGALLVCVSDYMKM